MLRKLPTKDKHDHTLAIRVPKRIHIIIKETAKEMGLSISDYLVGILINELRTGVVKKDIKKRIERGNMLWAMFPDTMPPDLVKATPEESKLLIRAYKHSKKKKELKK